MDKKWYALYAAFSAVIRTTILWALCVSFMNNGICVRTIIAFVILIACPEIVDAAWHVRKKFKKEEAESGSVVVHTDI